jgi:hypothetical protein
LAGPATAWVRRGVAVTFCWWLRWPSMAAFWYDVALLIRWRCVIAVLLLMYVYCTLSCISVFYCFIMCMLILQCVYAIRTLWYWRSWHWLRLLAMVYWRLAVLFCVDSRHWLWIISMTFCYFIDYWLLFCWPLFCVIYWLMADIPLTVILLFR